MIHQKMKVAHLVAAAADPADVYVSLKNVIRGAFLVTTTNAGASVTGSTIAIKQATAVAGTSAKALTARSAKNIDGAAGDTLTEVAAGTGFTTDATASKIGAYLIDIDPEALDVTNGFDCAGLTFAGGVNTTVDVMFLAEMRYAGTGSDMAGVIAD